MASFSKRSPGWRAQIAIKGVRESKTFSTKAEATSWAAARETEIRKGAELGIALDKTCGDAFDRYVDEVSLHKRGHRWEAIRLRAIGACELNGIKIKDIKLSEVSTATLGAWRDLRMKTVTGSTINRELTLVSHVFSTARKEWKWISENPTTDVRRPATARPRDRMPTQAEIDQLCHSMNFTGDRTTTKTQAVAVAFLFAIETAMRAGEICGLIAGDIEGQVATLRMTKNGAKRHVPLSKRALELLALLPGQTEGTLFGLTPGMLDALFRKAKKNALVDGLHFHDSRHAAITRLARKLDVLDLARMVGHRDLRMLQVYYNESAADIAPRLD